MNFDDATLMAYVDGELDAATRASIAAACAADASLAARVEAQRELRRRVAAAYGPVLDQAVPERLASLLATPTARVVEIDKARLRDKWRAAAWQWRNWGAMAACLLLGIWLGRLWVAGEEANWVLTAAGQWQARGALAGALDESRSGSAAPAAVALALSFVDRDGRYCRSFRLHEAAVAGLACRSGDDWRIELLTRAPAVPSTGLRMAATPLPEPLLRQIDALIDGSPLEPTAEQAAIERRWRPEGR